MTCREWKAEYGKWWTDAGADAPDRPLPAGLAEHAAACGRCRLVYETLSASLGPRRAVPPAGLPDRVMAAIAKRSWLPRYRPLPVSALAVPALAAAGLALALIFILPGVSPRRETVTVTLLLEAPAARSVAVVGDWNGWDQKQGTLTDEDGDGVWEISVELPHSGEYRYQFIINGESWIPDPKAALQVDDGFGGVNSVLGI